jgi:hypothetical protein
MSLKDRTPEEGAVLAAVATMPFGGLVHFRLADGPITLERIAKYLQSLSSVLEDHAARHRAESSELNNLRRDIAGVRRLFGLGGE